VALVMVVAEEVVHRRSALALVVEQVQVPVMVSNF